jgi:hypothetical protein
MVVERVEEEPEKSSAKIAREAEFVVKQPEHEGIRRNLGVPSVEMWILEISLADAKSKTECIANRFQCVVPGRIKFDISC